MPTNPTIGNGSNLRIRRTRAREVDRLELPHRFDVLRDPFVAHPRRLRHREPAHDASDTVGNH